PRRDPAEDVDAAIVELDALVGRDSRTSQAIRIPVEREPAPRLGQIPAPPQRLRMQEPARGGVDERHLLPLRVEHDHADREALEDERELFELAGVERRDRRQGLSPSTPSAWVSMIRPRASPSPATSGIRLTRDVTCRPRRLTAGISRWLPMPVVSVSRMGMRRSSTGRPMSRLIRCFPTTSSWRRPHRSRAPSFQAVMTKFLSTTMTPACRLLRT